MPDMATKALRPPATIPYDKDFVVWTEETARLLRARRFADVDVEHLAEEVEDMGTSHKHEVRNRLAVLIQHLLKWRFQPEQRSRSWEATIATQRQEIDYVFEDSPSLRRRLADWIGKVYAGSARRAAIETGLPKEAFPGECPFSPEQIMDPDFLPD